MTSEDRWPDWTSRALQAGAHSSLSIGLPVQEAVTGALNLYAAEPHAFGDDAVAVAQTFASYASVAMAKRLPLRRQNNPRAAHGSRPRQPGRH